MLFGAESANDFVFAGVSCDEVDLLIGMLPFRVRMIHTGVAAGIDAVRNGIADVAGIPLSVDGLPDRDEISVVPGFSHGDRGYNLIVLRDRIDSDKIRTFLSVLESHQT